MWTLSERLKNKIKVLDTLNAIGLKYPQNQYVFKQFFLYWLKIVSFFHSGFSVHEASALSHDQTINRFKWLTLVSRLLRNAGKCSL